MVLRTADIGSTAVLRTVRWRPRERLFVIFVCGALVMIDLAPEQSASGFGTYRNIGGQSNEHERITRAALACPAGTQSDSSCFEPKSMTQLAGKDATWGAGGGSGDVGGVGYPDQVSTDVFTPEAHCDDADWVNVAKYPHSADAGTAALVVERRSG
jgi:hypothetical protein